MFLNVVKVVDRANNLVNFFYKSLLLASLVLPFAAIPGQASPNYQERDGIHGEIKYAEFCNQPNGLRARVVAEAGSRDSRVLGVEFKIYTRYSFGINAFGQQFGFPSGENWRSAARPVLNSSFGDKRFYDTGPIWYPLSSLVDSPVKFAIHVNHSRGKTIDLGGIVDMGKIEPGKCKVYDDGNFR